VDLNAAMPEWSDTLRGIAYIVWKLTYDQEYFNGVPKRLVTLKGRKIYDTRTEIIAYSENPALILYDYMINQVYGMGLLSSIIDATTWNAAANYCDTKNFMMNYFLGDRMQATKVIDTAIILFRGCMVWFDGKFYLRYADLNYESSCFEITDSHIVQDESGKAQVSVSQPSAGDKPNGLRVKFTDPTKDYLLDDLMVGESIGLIKELRLDGCADRNMALNLGNYNLERMKLDRTISGLFRDDALQLEPNDIIIFNSTALSISDQLMRVKDAVIQESGLVNLALDYESTDLYDDDLDTDIENVYSCTLPDAHDPPPGVTSVIKTEEVYYYRLRSFTRLKIDFSIPSNYPWIDHIEVWMSDDDVNYKHQFNVTSDFMIDPIEENTTYYIRLVSVNLWGIKQAFDDGYKITHLVIGKMTAPTSLASLICIANDNALNVYATEVADPDVEGYEFRFGSSWSGAVFLAYGLKPVLSLKGVKPGALTIYCDTKGNNGVYGTTPRFATITIPTAHGWSNLDSDTCDYSTGNHDNTEQYEYDETLYMRCSHTSSVLEGTYTSPEYDLGSSQTVLAWIEADIVVIGAGTTWADKFPSPTTWAEGMVATKSWGQIFELSEGPKVEMKIKAGTSSGVYTSFIEKAEILSGIVTGRYFQIEIKITDPNLNVYALVENCTLQYYS
jgi:hypothetical protein